MRTWILALLVAGCATDDLDEHDPIDDTAEDSDTADSDGLPFDTGPWRLTWETADRDGCDYGASGEDGLLLSAGGEDFLVEVADGPVSPATFDCNLRGFTFTCVDEDGRFLGGTFAGRGFFSGSFRDEACGTVQPYTASKD